MKLLIKYYQKSYQTQTFEQNLQPDRGQNDTCIYLYKLSKLQFGYKVYQVLSQHNDNQENRMTTGEYLKHCATCIKSKHNMLLYSYLHAIFNQCVFVCECVFMYF